MITGILSFSLIRVPSHIHPSLMLSAYEEAIHAQPTLDLDALIKAMECTKGKPLSKTEKEYLCCLVCGYSAYKMAFRRIHKRNPDVPEDFEDTESQRITKTIKSDTASRSIHSWLKEILNLNSDQERLPSGEHLIACLKTAGFKKKTSQSLEDKESQILNIMLQIPREVTLSPEQLDKAVKVLEQTLPGKFICFLKSLER